MCRWAVYLNGKFIKIFESKYRQHGIVKNLLMKKGYDPKISLMLISN